MDFTQFQLKYAQFMFPRDGRMLFECELWIGHPAKTTLLCGQFDHSNNYYYGIVQFGNVHEVERQWGAIRENHFRIDCNFGTIGFSANRKRSDAKKFFGDIVNG